MTDREGVIGPENELEASMYAALDGSRVERDRFLRLFLQSTFFVPERFQNAPIRNPSPEYPDPFFNLLAFSVEDRAIIPVFTGPVQLEAWAGRLLSHRILPAQKLLELSPKNWWLIVNPGSEIEKEFSPWEIDLLREGEASIPVLLRELAVDDEVTTLLEVREVPEGEVPEVHRLLSEIGEQDPSIRSVKMAFESVRTADGSEDLRLVVVVRARDRAQGSLKELEEAVRDKVALALIGSYSLFVIAAPDVEDSLLIKPYEHIEPLFTRSTGAGRFMAKVRDAFGFGRKA